MTEKSEEFGLGCAQTGFYVKAAIPRFADNIMSHMFTSMHVRFSLTVY